MNGQYHHGNLRRALLEEAVTVIEETGVDSVSLRDLARRIGVSHAAPAHHFGDRKGLFTALAVQGLGQLAAALREATKNGFEEAAVAYVRFARTHPGHYSVMYQQALVHSDDGALIAARAEARQALMAGVESIPVSRRSFLTDQEAAHVAWALVHGLTARADEGGECKDLDDLTRRAARQLFG